MLDHFAETVFIDQRGRIVAHHWDLPEAGDEEQELEVCVDEWGQHDGLAHPVRSTVLDRNTGENVAEIIVTDVCLEPYSEEVFSLEVEDRRESMRSSTPNGLKRWRIKSAANEFLFISRHTLHPRRNNRH